MRVTPIKTPIINPNDNLEAVLRAVLPPLAEKTIVVITSKVVALAENRVYDLNDPMFPADLDERAKKQWLAAQLADAALDPNDSQYNIMLTITDSILAVNAGVDESNVAAGLLVALPEDSYASAERIWHFLRQEYGLKEVGVVITDSTSMPLKWGTVGRCLGFCGFVGLKNCIGDADLFDRPLVMTQMNIAEGIAAAAVLEMGEGDQATPVALVTEGRHFEFMDRPLTSAEQAELTIELKDDVYYPLLRLFENNAIKK